jgi:hypothetical protein
MPADPESQPTSEPDRLEAAADQAIAAYHEAMLSVAYDAGLSVANAMFNAPDISSLPTSDGHQTSDGAGMSYSPGSDAVSVDNSSNPDGGHTCEVHSYEVGGWSIDSSHVSSGSGDFSAGSADTYNSSDAGSYHDSPSDGGGGFSSFHDTGSHSGGHSGGVLDSAQPTTPDVRGLDFPAPSGQ